MFVRVEKNSKGLRVETCPISGTIRRGADAVEDAKNIQKILADTKEESELTMCTDVDRNDKSRICKPGSVKVIGRRQIEMYSKLIHTVDWCEGYLREGFDSLDAFLVHTWAVTVTGAPKPSAIQFVERMEKTRRDWYGGAVGLLGFDGHMNTGLTLRTIRIKGGVAEVRAGATLLWDSDPMSEEKETELKASALMDALMNPVKETMEERDDVPPICLAQPVEYLLLIDHRDSFVHTLANYARQTGVKEVRTVRYDHALADIQRRRPDFVIMSPGPGHPSDFECSTTLAYLAQHRIPTFGVCLGLQSMVAHFGGKLHILDTPVHGKPAVVHITQQDPGVFAQLRLDINQEFTVARYHSLYAGELPACLVKTAFTKDVSNEGQEVVMGVKHDSLPFAAVQFHPESIITGRHNGLVMLVNAINLLTKEK